MSEVEQNIARLLSEEDHVGVVEEALHAYGGELYGFIVSRLGSEQEADEVYARLNEDLWRGISGYRGAASFRAWLYALARNACHRYLDRELRPRRRHDPLSAVQEPAAIQGRSDTAAHLRTTGKQRGQLLRERLSEEEQVLLTLRVDRGLDWREVALALGADEDSLDRAAARHRKRFQLVRQKLARWAEEQGWLNGASEVTTPPP